MSPSPELAERIRWFIRLRWLAVAGILIAAGVVASLDLRISWRHLCGLAALLGGLNVVFAGLSHRRIPPVPFTWWQIVMDLTVLTLALHVAGGIENPFAFFYVFHVIIASILLPPRVSYLVAALASLFFLAMALLEYLRVVPHAELGFVRWDNARHLAAASAALAFSLFSSSYLASTIMEGLRRKDEDMRRFNERLLQTEKLAAIGQLAAGIAHELNTPLASISGYAEELGEIVQGAGEKVVQYTGVIRSQTERCKAITQSLLNFARKSEIRIQPVDVNAVLREAIDYLRFKKRATRLEIETDLADVPAVQADPGQLLQVFLSVLVNAADAIVGGGTITVRSRAGKDVQVTVADTGCGIPEENLKKIFEPFFTTKEPGEGTGLGLSLSYGIVKQLGGSIDLKSRVGEGTEVTITLPKAGLMSEKPGVLVVDDDDSFRSLVADRLTRTGHRVAAAAGGEAALALLDGVEVAVVDLLMPGMDGLTLLRKIREANPDIAVIILTGHGTIDNAVEAMKFGAADYLQKPCSLAEVELRISQVWDKTRLKKENQQLRAALQHENPYHGIVGKSPAMQAVFELIRKVKDSPSPVLIEGESGTGKELVARALHFDSARKEMPFVAVNCATLQETLLESELFGHKAGAYTGALQDKRGLLEIADRGTLFVDEIAETHPNVQSKLLRVLETGEFRAVGDVKEKKVTVRLVAATNKDLRAEVGKGRFREDLFYRLNVVSIRLPALRDRGGDIALLARHFLLRKGRTIGDRAMATLMGHTWPGNVRELFNTLERAVLFSSSGRIDAVEIPSGAGAPAPKDGTLEEVEVAHIKRVLESVQWNISRAAEILGTSRRNLHRKINQHNLKK